VAVNFVGDGKRQRLTTATTLLELYDQFARYRYVGCEYLAFALLVANVSPGGAFSNNSSVSVEVSFTDGFQGYAYNWFLHEVFYKGCRKGLFKLPAGQGAEGTSATVGFTDSVKAKMGAAKLKMTSLAAELNSIPNMSLFFQPAKETAEEAPLEEDEEAGDGDP
jgi:hypothetical protein